MIRKIGNVLIGVGGFCMFESMLCLHERPLNMLMAMFASFMVIGFGAVYRNEKRPRKPASKSER